MANTIDPYDPYLYANLALEELRMNLGLARSVHRGYDKDPTTKGSTIKIRRPASFTAANMPITTAGDITPTEVEVTVDQWKGVRFALTDKELSFTKEQIIEDHVGPAAYAIAVAIDDALQAEILNIPWYMAGGSAITDFTSARKNLGDQKVPIPGRFYMFDSTLEAAYLALAVFHSANTGAGGEATQREGDLGRKFGFDNFSSQNVQDFVAGAAVPGTALQINATVAAGLNAVVFKDSGASLTGDVHVGDSFSIAGNAQRYAITAQADAASNLISVAFVPALAAQATASAVVTLRQEDKALSLAGHKSAICLAMAPLSDLANTLGAKIATVFDPVSGLALRSRLWYDGDNAEVNVGIDALFGTKTLDPNRAIRVER